MTRRPPIHILFPGRRFQASSGGGSPELGVPFRVDGITALYPDARLVVEAAFGADITTDSAGWNWFDITRDVRLADGGVISITRGRSDESSQAQPATATLALDNTSGNYTAWSVNSVYYPNIGRNTPLRVRVDLHGDGSTSVTRMFGYALGWVPTWDTTGNVPVISVTFKGILQRLQQGKAKARSALRRFHDVWPLQPIAYWPCEDAASAVAPSSALTDGTAMSVSIGATSNAYPKFAAATARTQPASTGFEVLQVATDPLVSLGDGGGLYATVPARVGASIIYNVTFLGFTWASDGGSDITLVRIDTPGGRYTRFEVIVEASGGAPALYGWTNDTPAVKTLLTSSALSFPDLINYRLSFVDNGDGTFRVTMRNTRATTTAEFGVVNSATITGQLAWPTVIYANPYNSTVNKVGVIGSTNMTNDIIIGHLAVWESSLALGAPTASFSGTFSDGTYRSAWGGWVGEPAHDRVTRLCSEDGIPLTVTGSSYIKMGIQTSANILTLLRDVEATDFGVLYDGYTQGLGYVTGSNRYNTSATVTANMAASPPQVADPFTPADDDQRQRNSFKVTRSAGGEATFVQSTGALGVDAIGEYSDSVQVNTQTATNLLDMASWKVHLGTVEGYRYPRLNFDIAATPALALSWLAAGPLDRVDVTNVTSVATGHAPGTISQILEGYTETLTPFDWTVTANCSPFSPYRVIVLASTTGDTGEYLGRLDTDDTTLTLDVAAGASSFTVQVNSGQFWTTTSVTPDDFPLDVNINGIQVTVTAIGDPFGGNNQTFTVTPATVTRALGAHSQVNVWNPVVLAL